MDAPFSFSCIYPKSIWVFPKIAVPPIIHFNRVFYYKPSILGYPYFWKHPFGLHFFSKDTSWKFPLLGLLCNLISIVLFAQNYYFFNKCREIIVLTYNLLQNRQIDIMLIEHGEKPDYFFPALFQNHKCVSNVFVNECGKVLLFQEGWLFKLQQTIYTWWCLLNLLNAETGKMIFEAKPVVYLIHCIWIDL